MDIYGLIKKTTSWNIDRVKLNAPQIVSSGNIEVQQRNSLEPYTIAAGIGPIKESNMASLRANLQDLNTNTVLTIFPPVRLMQGYSISSSNVNALRTVGLTGQSYFHATRQTSLVSTSTDFFILNNIGLPSNVTNYRVNYAVYSNVKTGISLTNDAGAVIDISNSSLNLISKGTYNGTTTRPAGGSTIKITVNPLAGTTPNIFIYADVFYFSGTVQPYTIANRILSLDTSNLTAGGYLFKAGDVISLDGGNYPAIVTRDIPLEVSTNLSVPIDRNLPPQDGFNHGGRGIRIGPAVSYQVVMTEVPSFTQEGLLTDPNQTLKLFEVVNSNGQV